MADKKLTNLALRLFCANEMRLKEREVLNPIGSRTNLRASAAVQVRYGLHRKPREIQFWLHAIRPIESLAVTLHVVTRQVLPWAR